MNLFLLALAWLFTAWSSARVRSDLLGLTPPNRTPVRAIIAVLLANQATFMAAPSWWSMPLVTAAASYMGSAAIVGPLSARRGIRTTVPAAIDSLDRRVVIGVGVVGLVLAVLGWGSLAWFGLVGVAVYGGLRHRAVVGVQLARRAGLRAPLAWVLGLNEASFDALTGISFRDDAIVISPTPSVTLGRIAAMPAAVAQALPDWELQRADAEAVVLVPASDATRQARSWGQATGGLVAGAQDQAPPIAPGGTISIDSWGE